MNPLVPLSLTWINFDPNMDKNYMPSKVWNEITYPFQNVNGCNVEVWELLSNFTQHFIMDVITYQCWD